MQKLSNFTLGTLIAASLLLPLSAYAVGIPFGGLIGAETPCHVGPVPALWINVLGFSFIDVLTAPPAGTIPFPLYAPVVGQFILGLADTPLTCSVGTVPLPPGLRIQMFGDSGL
jgi:hypothetical protein